MARHRKHRHSIQKKKEKVVQFDLVDENSNKVERVGVSREDVKKMAEVAKSLGMTNTDRIPVEVTTNEEGRPAKIRIRDNPDYQALKLNAVTGAELKAEASGEPEQLIIGGYSKRITPEELSGAFVAIARSRLATFEQSAAFWSVMAWGASFAEVFEFGEVDDKKLKVEAIRGGKLWYDKHLFLPYKAVVYWYTLKSDPADTIKWLEDQGEKLDPSIPLNLDRTTRYCTIAVAPPHEEIPVEGPLDGVGHVFAADFVEAPPELLEHGRSRVKIPGHYFFMLANAVIFCGDGQGWKATSIESIVKDNTKYDARMMGGLADGVVGLSMVLATRGVPIRREEPPPKVNAKRQKNGKPLLTRVTHVDTAHYYEAMANTHKGGTHASPVPHLRRGHVRTYKTGKSIWIKDMLVNCRSLDEIKPRDHYEVETE